ncbi:MULTISPECIES: hypothetical protein [unclassified Rhodococcus (in: high G+C Gram-positive bacteria)]|uniref:hypothetical protein n=1 Tax=unclassified Rhodococcus (in: high G+C Gram-positive bacteria) TaxID=192944 RepID=UPI000B1E8FCC|nr:MULTISPECIES: hypothetical protein [unclassified Rhodococcus (in: high G+C Gram-positive bacteria)]
MSCSISNLGPISAELPSVDLGSIAADGLNLGGVTGDLGATVRVWMSSRGK